MVTGKDWSDHKWGMTPFYYQSQLQSHVLTHMCKYLILIHYIPPSLQVVKQAMRKMGKTLPLKEWLAEFLLIYRTTPHATTERHPDELFYIVNSEHISHGFSQPDTYSGTPSAMPESSIWWKERASNFLGRGKGLVCNQRGWTKWLISTIIRKKSLVTYLVRMAEHCEVLLFWLFAACCWIDTRWQLTSTTW